MRAEFTQQKSLNRRGSDHGSCRISDKEQADTGVAIRPMTSRSICLSKRYIESTCSASPAIADGVT